MTELLLDFLQNNFPPEKLNFEKEFAKFCETKHAVTVNSGTSALILSLKALELKEEDVK